MYVYRCTIFTGVYVRQLFNGNVATYKVLLFRNVITKGCELRTRIGPTHQVGR